MKRTENDVGIMHSEAAWPATTVPFLTVTSFCYVSGHHYPPRLENPG